MLIHAIYSAELYRHIASRLRYSSVSHPSFELEEWQHPPVPEWKGLLAGGHGVWMSVYMSWLHYGIQLLLHLQINVLSLQFSWQLQTLHISHFTQSGWLMSLYKNSHNYFQSVSAAGKVHTCTELHIKTAKTRSDHTVHIVLHHLKTQVDQLQHSTRKLKSTSI